MKFKTHKKHERLSEINIIPLVDIMLVLLIIFMVTAPMLKEGVDINLPEVDAKSLPTQQDEFILSIDQDGRIFFNDDPKEKYSMVSIEERLDEFFRDKPKKEIFIKADKTVRYGYLMEVMAACQRVGIERVGMISARPDEEGIK